YCPECHGILCCPIFIDDIQASGPQHCPEIPRISHNAGAAASKRHAQRLEEVSARLKANLLIIVSQSSGVQCVEWQTRSASRASRK
ncbi:UNVERIFIED_CONTAM: hypothetical protein NY603_30530, partial [Bacteroidetes bacterium 56_B9]